jgi:long-subunit acyl-CoA synthetase (AMP-forming)
LVKLRGGEYVSLTKVEMVIGKIPIIENSCLYASGTAEYTVALLCPNTKQMAVSFYSFLSINKIILFIGLYRTTFWRKRMAKIS